MPDPVDQRREADPGGAFSAQRGEAGPGGDGRPQQRTGDVSEAVTGEVRIAPSSLPRWLVQIGRLLFIFVCIELGLFLIIYPWSQYWERNYFAGLPGVWATVWRSPYFRGAVSGVGLLDLLLALGEMFRLLGWFRMR